MIEKSRKIASGTMKTIYFVTVASMFGAAIPYFWRALRQGSSTVLMVNGIGVTSFEYAHAIHKERVLLSAIRERFGVYYEHMLKYMGKSEQVESQVLEQLIIQKILIAYAGRMGIVLSPLFVGHELRTARIVYSVLGEVIPGNIITEQGTINYENLTSFLQRQGLTMAQFEAMLDDHLLIAEAIRAIKGAHVVSEAERALFMVPRTCTRTFSVELMPLEPFLKEEHLKPVSDETLHNYFMQENRTVRRYWSPERRSGTVWTFDGERFLKHAQEGTDQASSKEPREQLFERAFRLEADQVLLGGGDDATRRFIEDNLAKQSSLTKVSHEKGDRDILVAALFDLANLHSRVAVVKGMKGYIIELGEIHHPEERSFEFVKERVRTDYQRDQAMKALKSAIKEQAVRRLEKKTLELKPDVTEVPEEFKGFGITGASLAKLVAVGQELSGFGTAGGYTLRVASVSEPSKDLIQKFGGKTAFDRALDQAAAELIVRQLVASLRNHAILSEVQLKAS
jgi:hypothetical protein